MSINRFHSRRALAGAALLLLVGLWSLRLLADQGSRWLRREPGGDVDSGPMIRFGIVAAFVVGTVLFANLAARTEARLAVGECSRRSFTYTGDFYMPSAVLAYRAYTRLEGFDERREAMRLFLVRQGLDP